MAGTYLPGWLDDMMSDPKFVDERQLKQEAQEQRDEVLRQKLMMVMRASQMPPVQAAQDIAPRKIDLAPPPDPMPAPAPTPPDPGVPPPTNNYWA